MKPALYNELVGWYRLLDPVEEHGPECEAYRDALLGAIEGEAKTLLELGSGAGHNAFFMKRRFDCTLVDLSPGMRALSADLNPDCEHVEGDMRTVRLGRRFDAVLLHDAICYMLTEADLKAAFTTAWLHLRPGGAAVIAPDFLSETFAEGHELIVDDVDGRSLRCLAWTHDPDPNDTTCISDYAFLLREGGEVTAVHDRHIEGLFPRATWLRLMAAVGFEVHMASRPMGDTEPYADEVFVGVRPAR